MQCGRCIGIGKGQEFKDNINVRTIGAVWRGPRAVRTIVWQRLVFAIIGFWKFDVVKFESYTVTQLLRWLYTAKAVLYPKNSTTSSVLECLFQEYLRQS